MARTLRLSGGAVRQFDRYTKIFAFTERERSALLTRVANDPRSYTADGYISSDAIIRTVEEIVRERADGDAQIAAHLAARKGGVQ